MNMCTEKHDCEQASSCNGYGKHGVKEFKQLTEARVSGFQNILNIYVAYLEGMLQTLEKFSLELTRPHKTTPAMIGMAFMVLDYLAIVSLRNSSPGTKYKELTADEQKQIDPLLNRLNNAIQAVINCLVAPLTGYVSPDNLEQFAQALKIAERRYMVYSIQFGIESRQYKAAKSTADQLRGRVVYKR